MAKATAADGADCGNQDLSNRHLTEDPGHRGGRCDGRLGLKANFCKCGGLSCSPYYGRRALVWHAKITQCESQQSCYNYENDCQDAHCPADSGWDGLHLLSRSHMAVEECRDSDNQHREAYLGYKGACRPNVDVRVRKRVVSGHEVARCFGRAGTDVQSSDEETSKNQHQPDHYETDANLTQSQCQIIFENFNRVGMLRVFYPTLPPKCSGR